MRSWSGNSNRSRCEGVNSDCRFDSNEFREISADAESFRDFLMPVVRGVIGGFDRSVGMMRCRLAMVGVVLVIVRQRVAHFDTGRTKSYRQCRERTKNVEARKSHHKG